MENVDTLTPSRNERPEVRPGLVAARRHRDIRSDGASGFKPDTDLSDGEDNSGAGNGFSSVFPLPKGMRPCPAGEAMALQKQIRVGGHGIPADFA